MTEMDEIIQRAREVIEDTHAVVQSLHDMHDAYVAKGRKLSFEQWFDVKRAAYEASKEETK